MNKQILEKNILNNINGQIFKYDEIEFISNYSTILDEILNKSLFEDKKIIIIFLTFSTLLITYFVYNL